MKTQIDKYLSEKQAMYSPATVKTMRAKLRTVSEFGLDPQYLFNALKHAGYSAYTSRVYMILAAGFEEWRYQTTKIKSWLKTNAFVFRNSYQRKIEAVSKEQVAELIENSPTPEIRNAIILMAHLGLRISEVETATWGDIKDQILTVRGKGGKVRRVPIPHKWFKFLSVNITPSSIPHNAKIAEVAGRHIIQRYILKASNSMLTAHDLRSFYITEKLAEGFTLAEVRELVGHSSISTTNVYCRIHTDELFKKIIGGN